MRPVADQTILITGATDGLGKAVATELAATGARLVLHGRDDGKGADTLREIQQQTGNGHLSWYRADLSSLQETAGLAARLGGAYGRLDTVVNNAGVGFAGAGDGRRAVSRDKYELRFAVNYLAPYLLTRRLEPLLRRSAPARVVNVASAGEEPFDLAAELAGTGVTVNCLHPATLMPTKMVNGFVKPRSSEADGAAATMRLIVSPALENVTGRYYDGLLEARALDQAYDEDALQRLRKMSDQLTGLISGN